VTPPTPVPTCSAKGEVGSYPDCHINPANHLPVAVKDFFQSKGKPSIGDVLANDHDPDGDHLTVTHNTQGAVGKASCNSNGMCVYFPGSHYDGNDSFSYTVSDGRGGIASARVFVRAKKLQPEPFTGFEHEHFFWLPITHKLPGGNPACGEATLTVLFPGRSRQFRVEGALNPTGSIAHENACEDKADNGAYVEMQEDLANSDDPGWKHISSRVTDRSGGVNIDKSFNSFTAPTVHLNGVRLRICEDVPNGSDKCNHWSYFADPWEN
jgi:hypothetical protein